MRSFFERKTIFVLLLLLLLGGCKTETPPPTELPPVVGECSQTSVGFPPIIDLGSGLWNGFQGGLYPGGSNERPGVHESAGLGLANAVTPLDTLGNPDSLNGKIVFASIGFSNARIEFEPFEEMIEALPNKNPFLELANTAVGGQDINKIMDPNADYWTTVLNKLTDYGFTPLQVQVIWFKNAEARPAFSTSDTTFPGYADTLREKFVAVMHILDDMFPNARLCYIASRIYGGYDNTPANPEPYAYYQGWSVKWMIEDQINGDPGLAFDGAGRVSPWLSWGGYLWADGTTPRSDGLTWICPDDFEPDGHHPSVPVGSEKAAQVMFDYFMTDTTAAIWMLE